MFAGDVKVVHVVAEMIVVGEYAAPGAYGERKGEAMLLAVGARVHARLHDALADAAGVAEAGEVADGVEVQLDLMASRSQCGLDGILNVETVEDLVDGHVLILDFECSMSDLLF